MNYVFQFGVVFDHLPELLYGAQRTLEISAESTALGMALGVAGAVAAGSRRVGLRAAVASYVEIVRNTPLLVQLFIIYFALPEIGVRLPANTAAIVGLGLNFGAYATEIIRSGLEAVPRGQIEAGRALGLGRFAIIRLIVLVPALRIVYPALVSQFVLLMLGSSLVSAISAVDLTAITNTLQSTTFRSFEFYFAATLLYLAMALVCRAALGGVGRIFFGRWPA
jgi:polar amino acid transport system permease protein